MSENQAGSWHRDQMRHHLAAHTPIQMDSTQPTLAAAFHHPTANPVGFQLPPTFPGPNALTPNSLYSVPPTSEFDSDEKKSSIFQSQSDFDVWGAAQNCKLSPSEATIVRTATPSANSTESTPTPSSQRHSVGPEEHHEGGEVATKTASNDHDMEQQALREPKSEVMDDATAEATNLLLSLAQHHQDMQPMDTDSASSSQQAVLPTIPQFGQSPTSIAESIASVVNSVATADFEINIPAPVAALRNNATTPTTPNKNSRGFFRPPGLAPSEATATTMADNTKAFICQICSFSCPSRFHYNSHMNTHSDHKCSMCDYTSRTEGRLKKHMREFHTREEQIAAGLDISMMLPQTQSQTPNGNSMNGIPGGQLDVSTGSHGSGGDLSSTMASIMEVANRAIANESSASISDDQATASALESIRAFTENSQNGLANLFHLPPSNPSGNGKPEEAGPSSALTPSTPAAPPRRSGGTKPKKYSCKQCGIISYSKEESWRHNRTHIPVEKQLTCQQCDFVTEYKHHLEYHIRNHYGSKPFKCVKCNYTCVNKSMLNSHMKSHSNNYQFQCMDCNYQSKYCHSLKMHLRKYGHRRKPGTNLDIDDHEEAILNDPSLEDPGSVASAYSDAGNPSTSGLALPTVSVSTAQAGQNGLQQNPESAVTPNQMTNVFSNNLAGQNQMNYVNMLRTLSDLNALNQSSADSLMQQQVNGLVSLGQQQPQQQSQPSSINAIMQYLGQLGQQSPVINGAPPAPPAQQQGLGSALGGFNAADFIQQMQLAQQQQRTFSQPMQTGDVKMEVDVTSAMTPGASSIDGSASSGERSSTSPMESKDGSSVGSTVSSSSKKRKSTKSSKSLEAISQRLASKNSPEQYGEMAMPQPIPASAFKQPFFDRNPSATATVTVGSSAAGSSLPGLSYANNCEHCEIGFGNNALYSIHKGYHNFENPLKCNGCGKTFDSALNFNLHLWHERHV